MDHSPPRPRLVTGKAPKYIPKGSSVQEQLAKNKWYIEYYFAGKQIRVSPRSLNRIKDYKEKEARAKLELDTIKYQLANGYNPNDPTNYLIKVLKEVTPINSGIEFFKEYHNVHATKKKTLQTYLSKLKAFSAFLNNKEIQSITTEDLENFVRKKIIDGTYSHNSVKAAKRTLSTFFNVLLKNKYIIENPLKGFDKKIVSRKVTAESHVPYSDADLELVLKDLDLNDKYGALFCRFIYHTCLRPGELKGLILSNINLRNNTITIPVNIAKVTTKNESDTVPINPIVREFLLNLDLGKFPQHFHLFGNSNTIIGEHPIGVNTPYNKLKASLKRIDNNQLKVEHPLKNYEPLSKKGYDLYSFKHTSNIHKYRDGWKVSEIQKLNRHGNPSTTEIYLKKLGNFIDIEHLPIREI